MKALKQILEHLQELGIGYYEYREDDILCGYELDTYTDAGVNMIIFLDFRDTDLNPKNPNDFLKVFKERIESIDIDEEIELHRQDKRYCNDFTIKESLKDFKDWKNGLLNVFTEERGFYSNRKSAQQRQFEQVVDKLRSQLQEMENTIKLMPRKGNNTATCQRTNISNILGGLDHCINGIELEDFTPNEYSGDFKLSYS